MAAVPELVYFDGRGRGEIIRLALAAANIQFRDIPLETRDEFLALKPELTFEQVPLLRIDGLSLIQTHAIVRYVARKANLLGSTDVEIAKVDQLFEGTRDMYTGFLGFGFNPDEAVKDFIEKSLTKYLPIYNKLLEDNGSTGYLVGSKMTIADVGLFEVIQATIDYFTEDRLKNFPELVKFYKTMISLDVIKHYLTDVRKRPNDKKYCSTVETVLNRPVGMSAK